ncbi:acetone carboxylase subunit gamma [Natrinema saccharevitans]|uniref:acetone carboxylase subunit gamma n=1 Tax=Natrinema saccharevitans TaxID=301967 RepID=UPI00096BF663
MLAAVRVVCGGSVLVRRFHCPDCAVLIDHEIARTEDPILHDLETDLEALRARTHRRGHLADPPHRAITF